MSERTKGWFLQNLVGLITLVGVLIGWAISYGNQQAHEDALQTLLKSDDAIVQRMKEANTRIEVVLDEVRTTLVDHEDRLRRIENPRLSSPAPVIVQHPAVIPDTNDDPSPRRER